MSRPKRRWTLPLGTGRSSSLGANDPRARRDGNARATTTPDPLIDKDELAAVVARLEALEAAPATTTTETTETTETGGADLPGGPGGSESTTVVNVQEATWQFDLSGGPDYGYVSYGDDVEWEAHRWDAANQDTELGALSSKPQTLGDFQDIWPS